MTATNTNQNSSNRLVLDYKREASQFAALPYPIVDVHSHICGDRGAKIYGVAARRQGIGLTYSMTDPECADSVRRVLGDSVRFTDCGP